MRRKPYPVSQLTGGLNVSVDAVFLTDKQSPNLKMVRFDKGVIKKDLGFTSYGNCQVLVNRSMEANANWANFGSPTNNQRSNAQARTGTYSRLLVGSNGEGMYNTSNIVHNVTGNLANFTIGIWIYCSAAPNVNKGIYIELYDPSSNTVVIGCARSWLTANTWLELNYAGSWSVGTNTTYQFRVKVYNNANATDESTYYVDDAYVIREDGYLFERIMTFDNYYKVDGSEYLILFTPTRLYVYSSGTWQVEYEGFTGSKDDIFSTTVFSDLLLFTNGYDAVKKWDGATLASLGGLTAPVSLTQAKCITSFNTRVILGNTVEGGTACPYRVRWSATGEEEQWNPATYTDAGFIDLVDTSDWIVGFGILVDRLFVFKERSIWELLPTRDTRVFEPRMVIDGVGTYCQKSITSLGDTILFFGTDDVYYFDGTSLKSAGENIFPLLYTTEDRRVNTTKLSRASSVYLEELGDYILCLATIGDEPDWLLRYNVNDGSWSQRDLEVTAFGFASQGTQENWSDSTGYWDDSRYAVSWFSGRVSEGAPLTIYGDSEGRITLDNRQTKSSETFLWESKDFIFAHSQRVVAFSMKCRGSGDVTLSYSVDQGANWVTCYTFTPNISEWTEEKYFMNLTCDMVRFRVVTNADDFELMWIEPWYVDRTRTTSPSLD